MNNFDSPYCVKILKPIARPWQLQLSEGSELQFFLPTAPNLFHRWMQRLCFGVVWTYVGEKK
jgi:hypothetical protein